MIKEKKTPQYNSMPPRKLSSAEIQAIVEWQKKDSSGGGHASRAAQGRGRAEQGETEDRAGQGRIGQHRTLQPKRRTGPDRRTGPREAQNEKQIEEMQERMQT